MPKMKTHKGLAKRVKVTARKKVIRKMSCAGHLMSGKSGQRKQRLRKKVAFEGGFAFRALRALCAD